MKIKLNWGFWIVVSFILFAAGTFTMVYISMSAKVDLVTDDYYEKELKYQQHIDLVKTTNALEQKVDMGRTLESLIITFPNVHEYRKYSGTIYFFRPSDKQMDFSRDISIDSLFKQTFPIGQFVPGLWRAKIAWNVPGQEYYSEFPIMVQ